MWFIVSNGQRQALNKNLLLKINKNQEKEILVKVSNDVLKSVVFTLLKLLKLKTAKTWYALCVYVITDMRF